MPVVAMYYVRGVSRTSDEFGHRLLEETHPLSVVPIAVGILPVVQVLAVHEIEHDPFVIQGHDAELPFDPYFGLLCQHMFHPFPVFSADARHERDDDTDVEPHPPQT